ncbi:PINIT domain-containing protein [Schizophyllum amplum]|uniref:PINIT domain-containing protein n=1 Tax=Schizophyllum amplum TaxID=97359 RepID=A0A550C5Z3_9AGAR|nr:PINIT domain-containing protein [Auriculariopsis ampla]
MNAEEQWTKAKSVINQVRNTGLYTPRSSIYTNHQPSTSASASAYPYHKATAASVPSSVPRYDPYAPPRRPSGNTTAAPSPQKPKGIRFKESPFFHVLDTLGPIAECPESASATDRRQQTLSFAVPTDVAGKLKLPGYQLRLFCTSSIFYSTHPSFRSSPPPCLIEFPPTCEVRVNGAQITANLKGLKKKPGTAPPPDITKLVRQNGTQNRVEMVYINSQQPTVPKKYYITVMLVETTGVDSLVANLKKTGYRSSATIQAQMRSQMLEDDDIIAGASKMSLKCPLSFTRVTTPSRSTRCVHPQCFDAFMWFSVMEQTTTWLCPVCERQLDPKELMIDGYFDDILKATPDSVEDVIVEADGQWHTVDNKFGSEEWKATHPVATTSKQPPSKSSLSPTKPISTASDKGKGKVEVFELDSDDEDEDEGRVKRELSPSLAHSTQSIPPLRKQSANVIDLTLDSDDEEDVPIARTVPLATKRKADDAGIRAPSPSEVIWKRTRTDTAPGGGVLQSASSNNINGGGDYSRAPATSYSAYTLSRQANGSTNGAGQYGASSSYPEGSLSPAYPQYGASSYPRGSGSGRW